MAPKRPPSAGSEVKVVVTAGSDSEPDSEEENFRLGSALERCEKAALENDVDDSAIADVEVAVEDEDEEEDEVGGAEGSQKGEEEASSDEEEGRGITS